MSNDRLVLRRLGLGDVPDLPFVVFPPELVAEADAPLRHKLEVKPARAGLVFTRTDGPPGLAVSRDGVVTWTPPKSAAGQEFRAVILVAAPNGKESLHTLSIHVVRPGEKEIFRQRQRLNGGNDLIKIVEIARFSGHNDGANSVVFSPDGRRILSGSRDRTMILWDRETGREICRFKEHGGWIQSVAISPDGRRALSGSQDAIIRLWDLESGDLIREFRGHTEGVFSVAFSPDGRLAYSTSGGFLRGGWEDGRDAAIRVWDVETGREVRRLEGHRGIVRSMAVSPDGRRVLSGGRDGAVILWDAATGAEIRRFRGHTTDEIVCVAFLPDGRRAVSGGGDTDRTIRLWDVETGREIHSFRGNPQGLTWLAVSPDGRRLLSSHRSGSQLLLWDLEARKPIHHLDFGDVGTTGSGAFSLDGLHAAWGGGDGVIRMYRLKAAEKD
jgi:WD40 repeat protein